MKTTSLLLMVLMLTGSVWSQEKKTSLDVQDAIELINSKLSHSKIMGIDDKGLVRIKAPEQMIEFSILDVSFNYNDSDNRVRVAGDHNINYYEDERFVEVSHRQSFTCRSSRMAQDVIDALRRLKEQFAKDDPARQRLEKKLPQEDRSLGYSTMRQAMDFINDNLSLSLILDIDEEGMMIINAPSAIYRVDLAAAHFGLNDGSDRARVRIFGDWVISILEEGNRKKERFIARESFSVHSTSRARQSVKALYDLKGAFLGQSAPFEEENSFLRASIREDYRSIEEAVEYINDRLEVSIITGLDQNGIMTVNASEQIYKLPLKTCRFRAGRNRISVLGFGLFGGRGSVVEISSPKGLEKYTDRDLVRRVDGESFSARTKGAVKEIINAFEYIQNKIR